MVNAVKQAVHPQRAALQRDRDVPVGAIVQITFAFDEHGNLRL